MAQAIADRPGLHRPAPAAADGARRPRPARAGRRWRATRRRPWPAPASFCRAGRQARHARPGHRPPGRRHRSARTKSRCPPRAHPGQPAGRYGRCTLCLSCVSACPDAALADNPDKPQLRFTESKCVQCGLCAKTCPEDAITLQPRLWLADGGKARKTLRVLAEQEPYRCVKCSKPFGTLLAIENMLGKLSGHSAFQGAAAEPLEDVQRLPRHRHVFQPG